MHSFDVTWPTVVKCEMNIPEWERALQKYGLEEEYGFLIDGFKNGFDQGIPSHRLKHMKWFCPENHASALLAREKIEKNFDKETNARRLYGPFTKEEVYEKWGFFRTSPLGAVENNDG